MKLTDQLLALIESNQLPPRKATLIVAVSGGVDSMGLLHLLMPLSAKYEWRLVVAHLNHQLRAQALKDEQWVKKVAGGLGLPVVVSRVSVRQLAKRKKLTTEEAGRLARYDFLFKVAKRYHAKAIVVAHTADDQVETITMNWLRGAGVRGLAGMREWEGLIWRPLLSVPKADLRKLSHTLHFSYREDETNRQTVYTRNRIRQQVLPLLTKINPQIRNVLLRNAENLAGLEGWLDDYLVAARKAIKLRHLKQMVSWSLAPFKQLHPYIQNELMLWAVAQLQGDKQGYKAVHLAEMQKVIRSRERRSFKQLPGKLFLIKAYDKISVSRFKPKEL
jgi:tRNA(Ile)-lysidine synthase